VNAAVLVGLAFAGGLSLVLTGLRPAPAPLHRALAALRPTNVMHPELAEASGPLGRIVGSALVRTTLGERVLLRVRADLRVTGVTASDHLAARAAFAVTGLAWAPIVYGIAALGGVALPAVVPIWLSLALAPVGVLLPTLTLRSAAAERRRDFRHALSAFLDVVSVSLAGGRGVETALHDAAGAGRGWAFDEIRRALLEAQLLGDTPWAGIARLGTELDVPELGELAASASLAGAEGARVRASLAAKAKALRLQGLTEVEAAAQSASERMSLPIVALMVGFIVFIAYPAVDKVLHGV
jgi:Flp pilus assembly protein TadB